MALTERGIRSLTARARPGTLSAVLIGLVLYGVLASASPAAASDAGPVRLARFAYVQGDVSWRPNDQAEWSRAADNLPVRQGAQIAVSNGGRAELQFDDGSRLSLNHGAVITLRTLYSDSDGEFTELTVRDGTAAFRLRHERAVYQIDAPFVSIDASGPARFRVDASHGVQVAVRQGHAVVEGSQGKVTVSAGSFLDLRNPHDPYRVVSLPPPDSFDTWTDARYQHEDRYWNSPDRHYVPDDIAIVSDDLDDYGTWRHDPHYGEVWCPHETSADWRPYHHGHWVWVDPFGWTWVGDEPWGWAPYHYGTWVSEPYGWAWVPGPATQYWSPAVVDFYDDHGGIAWVPLAPREVHYPATLSIGISGGNWAAFFSIGGAAVYYPSGGGYFVPHPWQSRYVNRVTYVNNVTIVNHNTYFGRSYVPVNARLAAGATLASVSAFGGRGAFKALPRDPRPAFTRGRMVAAPSGSFQPVAGPQAVRPTFLARTPTRALLHSAPVSHAMLTRAIYRNPSHSSFAAARRVLAAAPVAASRAPNPIARTPQPARPAVTTARPQPHPANPAAVAAQRSRQIHAAAPHSPVAANLSPAQRAALQARTALGMKTHLARNLPGHNPAASRPVARAVATARHPNAPTAPHPNAAQVAHNQRAAAQARVASGSRPNHHAVSPQVHRAPARVTARAPHPAFHQRQPTHHSAALAHRYKPPAPHHTAPVHHYRPAAPRYTPPAHRSVPPSHAYMRPARPSAPPMRPAFRSAPPARAGGPRPMPRMPAGHSAPHPGSHPSRDRRHP